MGRRKIEIQPITHERNRAVTFVKRKNGLFKKAYELGVLCSVDVAVIIFEDRIDQSPKLHQYCSSSIGIDDIVRRHRAHSGDTETRNPTDFGSTPTAGTAKAAAQDMEDDEDDDDEETAETPVRGGRGRVTAGRAPNPPSRPTPNVSAVRSAPAPPRRSLPVRQAAAKRRRYAEDDDDDDDGDDDDEYKQRNEDEDAEGDEDGDGDYEYTGSGTSRRSGRMAEAAAEVRRTAGASLPVSNDRGGGERGSRNKRARVDEGPLRIEPAPRGSNDYVGSYRGDYGAGYRDEHSSSGYPGGGLHLHSRSRSPPLRSSYPYPYPGSGQGSSSYPSSGPGMSGSGYGGPGSYQPPTDVYSYPPPNPPPNPYPAPHTHSYPQQPQSYTRGPHRPFHTGTSSPNPGSPHSFHTNSPHPYSVQGQGAYAPLPSAHQQQQNGYGTPPQLRLEPPLRSDDSYLRADALYPPPTRQDNTYIQPPSMPTHMHAHSQYTLPPLDPAGPAAPRRTPPRRLRSQGRAHEDVYDESLSRRGSGIASMLDLPPVPAGGEAPFPPGVPSLGLPAGGGGAPPWEGAGTARELLNAFMSTPGPGSSSSVPATERTSVPRSTTAGAGEGGDLDWPVHAPPGMRVGGNDGSSVEGGTRRSDGEMARNFVASLESEPRRVSPETNINPRSTAFTSTEADTKDNTASIGRATSSNPTPTNSKPEQPTPTQNLPPLENTVPTTAKSDRRTPSPVPNSNRATSAERLVETKAAPLSGHANEADWLDFLSGAVAEANAAQRAAAAKADAPEPDRAEADRTPNSEEKQNSETRAGTAVDAAAKGVNPGVVDAEVEDAEDAEGEPDNEDDEPDVTIAVPSNARGAGTTTADSNASSLEDASQPKNISAQRSSSPSVHEEAAGEQSKTQPVDNVLAEDTTSQSPKVGAGDDMTVDRTV